MTETQANFIREIAPMIREEALARGYHVASPIIAQATVESFKKGGLSLLASKYHNYFGMKASKGWSGGVVNLKTGEEYTTGTITMITAGFRTYPNMRSGVNGYFDFISTKRYENLRTATTPEGYLQMIWLDGYATSSTYVQTNLQRIEMYHLRDYDKGFGTAYVAYSPAPNSIIKRGDKGSAVRWLQEKLNSRGYSLTVDGIFGVLTEAAVRDLQEQSGCLAVDGIVGRNTIKYLT